MALDPELVAEERARWNSIGSKANAVANMVVVYNDGTFPIPYDGGFAPEMTEAQQAELLARIVELRDEILAAYDASIVKTL